MKTLKLLSILVFAVFLVSTVAAFGDVYGEWVDESQSMTIVEGDSIDFNFDFFSMDTPMTVNIKLYDSSSSLIYAFESNSVINNPCTQDGEPISGTACYTGSETVDSTVYQDNPGFYELVFTYSDADSYSRSHILYLTVTAITDTNIPVITRLGINPVLVNLGDTYTDAGATAYDVEDGDITANIVVTGTVDTSTVGPYVLTYNVQDNAGNFAAPVTRTVSVSSPAIVDTTAPVITLLGNDPENVALGDTYTDAGATALDETDGDITSNIVVVNPVDTNTVNVYTVTYNVQDNSGNSATEVTRTVNVYDPNETTPPTITVITPEEDREYDISELTFEVEVNEVAEVNFRLNNGAQRTMDYIGMSGGILTFEYDITLDDGDYEVTFYATDVAGNIASVTVEFTVDTGASDSDKDQTTTNYYQSNYEEELYLNQFEHPRVIYLEDDVQQIDQLTGWQKFVAWLKKIFGFN